MRTICEYNLEVKIGQLITLSHGTEILSVGNQDNNLRMWVLQDLEEEKNQFIRLIFTAQDFVSMKLTRVNL